MDRPDKIYDYDAFISYRHIPRDAQIAEKLHKALETYRTPSYLVKRGIPSKLSKVFRDRDELPTSGDLGKDIENALMASKFLIVICSPEAVQSKWVLREVEFFGEYHGYDKILTLLADGEPAEAFPPGLVRYLYNDKGGISKVIEPFAADVRPNGGVSPLKLLKTEKLRIIAGILGCKYDELRQREQERRVRRIISLSVSAAAFLLAVTAFTLWQLSEVNVAREAAVRNEKMAQEEKDNALSTQSSLYASLAKQAADKGDRLLGMSLAMEALPKDLQNPEKPLTQDAKDALYYTAMQYGMQQLTYLYPPDATAKEAALWCFFNESSGDVVTVGSRAVRQFSPATGRLSDEWMASIGYEILAVSPGADRAVIARYESGKELDVQLWDIPQDRMVSQQAFDPGDDVAMIEDHLGIIGIGRIAKAGFEPEGKIFYIACNEYYLPVVDSDGNGIYQNKSEIFFYDSDSGKSVDLPKLSFDNEFGDIRFNGGQFVITLIRDFYAIDQKNIAEYDLQKNALLCQASSDEFLNMTEPDGQEQSLGITSDGSKFSFVDASNILHIVAANTGEVQEIPTDGCRISNDGNLAAFFRKDEQNYEQFVVQDLVLNRTIVVLEDNYPWKIPSIQDFMFCSNDRYVLFSDFKMLDIQRAELLLLPVEKSSMMYAESDTGGRYLVSLDQDGAAVVFQLKDPTDSETVVSAGPASAIRDSGVLLFENQPGGGTLVRKWDAAQKTVSITSHEEGAIGWLFDIAGGGIGFLSDDFDNFGILSTDTGRVERTFPLKGTEDFQMDTSGKYVLATSYDGVYLYDAQTGSQIRMLSASGGGDGNPAPMHSVGFFPGGKYCWSAVDNPDGYTGIVINNIETGKVVSHIDLVSVGGNSYFSALTSSDGSRMVVRSVVNLQLWSIDSRMNPEHICDLKGEFMCMDDYTIVTGYDDTVYIYDLKTGNLKATIKTPGAPCYQVMLVNGGKYLLTLTSTLRTVNWGSDSFDYCGTDHLMLWDCSTGKAVATLYNDYNDDANLRDFGLVNGGKEIVIVSEYNGKTYIRTIPFPASFDQVYNNAKEKLAGRIFDIEQDMAHIN